MKRTILSTIALLFFATNIFAAAWTGATSEPENMKKIDGKPFYVITNADELAWFTAKVNAGETTINAVLANDIVFGADTASFTNVGWKALKEFDGVFDGNNFKIYGLFLNNGSKGYSLDRESKYGDIDNTYFIRKLSKNGILKNIIFPDMKAPSSGTAGIVWENEGLLYNIHKRLNSGWTMGVVRLNNGIVRRCSYYPESTGRSGAYEYFVTQNNGLIDSCQSNYPIIGNNNGTIQYSVYYGYKNVSSTSFALTISNSGYIKYCIQHQITNDFYTGDNTGTIISSILTSTNSYYSNNKKIQLTEESMKSDLTAWKLNTLDGTEENSGVWTRGADGYPTFANEDSLAIRKVVFDDDGTTSNRYTNYKGLVTFPENPEPAEGYVFSGWYNSDDIKVKPTTVFTADQTVNAVYVDASDVFWTINFYNAAPADTVLESKSYQHGSIVTYGGVDPTLASTAQYTYTFKGWDVEPTNAVEDFDYHAVYDSTIRSYTVTFNNADGSKIESATFEYGKMPSCSKTPTRVATAEWTYSHKGWKPALDYVTEAATYTAIYDSSKVKYKVTFMNGTTVIDEQMVPYGDPAVAPTNVTREGYKFVGWNTSFATVTEALTVKALFEELIIRTVNVVDVDGDKIVNTTVEDGEKYALPEAPKKEGYTFDAYYDGNKKLGVAGDEISVTANITIVAKYLENPKSSSSSAVSSSSQQEIATSSSSSRNDKSSSSSSKINSSSSAKTEAIVATVVPKFSVMVNGRSLQISAARIGAAYALFDMQGKVLLQGRVQAANFEIPVMRAGSYLLKIESTTQRVSIR